MTVAADPPTKPAYRMGFLWAICLTAAMGGLLFGYDYVVIGGAKPFYEPYFGINESPFWQGFSMSSALLGCLIGAAVSGPTSDRFGRRGPLIASALVFLVSAIGTALASNLLMFNLFRGLCGVGIGLASNLSPMYIAEMAPAETRGRFVAINQLTIVIGILAAQVVNWLISLGVPENATPALIAGSWYGQQAWRWMFASGSVPALAFLLMMFAVPESPRWLVKAGREEPALRTLTRVGGPAYGRAELADIKSTIASDEVGRVRLADLLEPRLVPILILGIILALFQQLCGFNVLLNYAQEVFQEAGYGVNDVMFNIVITGVVNLIFTFLAIAVVDHWGRRPLMQIGAAGLAITFGLLGTGYYFQSTGPHMLFLVVSAIAVFAMSLGPVTWVVLSEIFPNRIRGTAMSVAVLALWAGCTTLNFTFPFLKQTLGPHGSFWLYAAVNVAGLLYITRRLPETKGKTLEDIERQLTGTP